MNPQVLNPKGDAPHRAKFRSKANDDNDAMDRLSFTWDFGDGSTGKGRKPKHTYKSAGKYKAWLTVTDRKGLQTKSAKIVIKVRQTAVTPPPLSPPPPSPPPPVAGDADLDAKIATPSEGDIVRIGDRVNFVGLAQDKDTKIEVQGVRLEWTVETGDGRTILSGYTKAAGSFVVPALLDSEDAAVLLSLAVTPDGGGLVDRKRIQLLPLRQTVQFAANPSWLNVRVRRGNENARVPSSSSLVVGQPVTLTAPDSVCISNIRYRFVSWSVQFDGFPTGLPGFNVVANSVAFSSQYTTPNVPTTVTAVYQVTDSC